MIVVADSSTLIALAVCDALPLLAELVDEILVPAAVFDEVVVEGRRHSERLRAFLEGRVQPLRVFDPEGGPAGLGQGELEAIALCARRNADLLLVDDQRARRAAEARGLRVSGSLGVLLMAKKQRLLPEIRPLLEKLKASDIRLSDELFRKALAMADEI